MKFDKRMIIIGLVLIAAGWIIYKKYMKKE